MIRATKESLLGESNCLRLQNAAAPRFGHSDVGFDLFIETRFFASYLPLVQFSKTFLAFWVSLDQNDLTYVKNIK